MPFRSMSIDIYNLNYINYDLLVHLGLRLTWYTNMTAASVKKQTGAGAALLLAGGEDVDVIGSILQTCGHY